MQVERTELRHLPDLFGQHSERHHHEQVGLIGGQFRKESRIFEPERLQHRNAVSHSVLLHRTLLHFEPATGRLVRHRDYRHHLVAFPHKGVERCHREFGSAHEYDALRPEETADEAGDLSPSSPEKVSVEEGGVVNGPVGEEEPYRRQHYGRYQGADGSVHRAVACQLGAGDIHHPVQHEEEHCHDYAGSQAALPDERAEGRSDEEEHQAGQCLREFLEQFDVGPFKTCVIFVSIGLVGVDFTGIAPCRIDCPGICLFLL